MLLSNPLAHPFLAPLGMTLLGIFAGSLMALLVKTRGHWEALRTSVLFQRWRTWLVIAPLFSLVVLSGAIPTSLFAAALAVQGSREYARLGGLGRFDTAVLLLGGTIAPLAILRVPPVALLLALPLLATLPALLQQDTARGAARIARLAFGLWYLPINLALLPRFDPGVLLAIGLAVALSDVGAFTFGNFIKGPKLAPRLSPSKTWAGCLGNLAGALLGLALMSQLSDRIQLWPMAAIVAVGAIWGDLVESLLKREAGAKDSGAWVPGFGGLLDRIDSLLIVLPLAYLLLEVTR